MDSSTSAKPMRIDSAPTKPLPSKKRVSRACDECRLHKARCDGSKTCETCFRYDRVCSYNLLPAQCKGSAARIRILEHRLAKARECIGNLQKQLPNNDPALLDETLAPQSDLKPSLATSPTSAISKTSGYSSPAESVRTVGIGRSLIESLLQPLSSIQQVRSLTNLNLARSLLCDTDPIHDHDTPLDHPRHLPPYGIMLETVFAAFNNIFGLCNIVIENEFRIVAQRLYDNDPKLYSREDTEFVPLFCGVIALGMICSTTLSHAHGYDEVLKQSLTHFEAASASVVDDRECTSLVNLQTTLCLVLFLLNTSKLDLARPALRTVCASPMVQGLFSNVSAQGPGTHSLLDLRTRDLVWVIHYLDLHVSGLLGSSALLSTPGPELATVHAINTAAHNVADYRRSHDTFLTSVAVAMSIELMKLIGRITSAVVVVNHRYGLPSPCSDVPEWNDLRTEFETWEFMLKNIFAENDGNLTLIMARHHLQCHFYLAQITLYHPFLRRHCEPKQMRPPPVVDEINKGQACAIAATNAITYISTYMDQSHASSLPLHSAYVLFISLLTLTAASTFADNRSRHRFVQTIQVATRVLMYSNFGSSRIKTIYMEFIQVLSSALENQTGLDLDRRGLASRAFSASKSPTSVKADPSTLNLDSPSDGPSRTTSHRRPSSTSNPSNKRSSTWDFDPC